MRLYKNFTQPELAMISDMLEAPPGQEMSIAIEEKRRKKLENYFNKKWQEALDSETTKEKNEKR